MSEYSTALLKYDDVDFLWICDHWDIHLTGLCKYRNKICRFETDNDPEHWDAGIMVTIYKLTLAEKVKWLLRKKLFEWCIGYHCTYPHRIKGVRFGGRRPGWFWQLIFVIFYQFKKAAK